MKKFYTAVIVDDNPVDVTAVVEHLRSSAIFDTLYTAYTVLEAYNLLISNSIDIVFLDIELSGKSGFDLLALMPNHPAIVVISAHSHYAVDCFDLRIADFISKPFTYPRLFRAIGRALVTNHSPVSTPALPAPTYVRENIYLKIGRKTERFFLDEILFIEAYGIYIKLHTKHGLFVVNEKISKIEQKLPNNQFIRIHKSYVINITCITRVESQAVYLDKARLGIGVTFKDHVHTILKKLAIEL